MVDIGRDLWRPLDPSPLLKQGNPEHVTQDYIPVYLRGGRLHNLSGHSGPMLGHPHSNKVFPDVQTEPSVFQFVPTPSGPVVVLSSGNTVIGHHQKEPDSVVFPPSLP